MNTFCRFAIHSFKWTTPPHTACTFIQANWQPPLSVSPLYCCTGRLTAAATAGGRVADIADAVIISIKLVRVKHVRAVIKGIKHPITIRINRGCCCCCCRRRCKYRCRITIPRVCKSSASCSIVNGKAGCAAIKNPASHCRSIPVKICTGQTGTRQKRRRPNVRNTAGYVNAGQSGTTIKCCIPNVCYAFHYGQAGQSGAPIKRPTPDARYAARYGQPGQPGAHKKRCCPNARNAARYHKSASLAARICNKHGLNPVVEYPILTAVVRIICLHIYAGEPDAILKRTSADTRNTGRNFQADQFRAAIKCVNSDVHNAAS